MGTFRNPKDLKAFIDILVSQGILKVLNSKLETSIYRDLLDSPCCYVEMWKQRRSFWWLIIDEPNNRQGNAEKSNGHIRKHRDGKMFFLRDLCKVLTSSITSEIFRGNVRKIYNKWCFVRFSSTKLEHLDDPCFTFSFPSKRLSRMLILDLRKFPSLVL